MSSLSLLLLIFLTMTVNGWALSLRMPLQTQTRSRHHRLRPTSSTRQQNLLHLSSTSTPTASEPSKVTCLDVKYDMEDIVSLCKRRGFVYPSSEIYNGFAGFYDYGPMGAELKKNVKDQWWKTFVTQREDVVGLDSSIIHNPMTWKSSGACRNECLLGWMDGWMRLHSFKSAYRIKLT
jgi:hypothetical protein